MAKRKASIVAKTVQKDVRKFYHGDLHSGSGHVVTNVKQALAIGYAQGRKKAAAASSARRKHGRR